MQIIFFVFLFSSLNNDKFNNSFGVYFTTWDLLFNEGGYLEIEKSLFGDNNNNNNNNTISISYYIIGGEQIYKKAIESNLDLTIYSTEIYTESKKPILCDIFFPKIDNKEMNKENNIVITNVSPFYKSNTQDLWFRYITYVKSKPISIDPSLFVLYIFLQLIGPLNNHRVLFLRSLVQHFHNIL